jgi:hypothetical protein
MVSGRGDVVTNPNPNRDPGETPILITDAQRSYEEELATRKRRYGLMMGMRVPCLVLAALLYQTPWLAATLILASIPLPWMAVIIANDRLPRKKSEFERHKTGIGDGTAPALPPGRMDGSGEHLVIDSPEEP